ncbi:MAG TPA: response regulator, partial [Proteobacteria bacterium]|nr:response regulator [Pseudomonadota bacterium]
MMGSGRKVKPVLLIVDDDESLLSSMRRALSMEFDVKTASTPASARYAYRSENPDVVLLDMRLDESVENDRTGIELLK